MDYSEIAEQLFNLVDNDKDKINSFFDCINSGGDVKHWFDMNVDPQELKDLYKQGENNQGFYKWISSDQGSEWFNRTPQQINQDNINSIDVPVDKITDNSTQIHKDIEAEDADIMTPEEKNIKTDMSDGDYSSEKIDDEDELDIALDMLDGSDEDVDVIIDIVDDGSDDEPEDSSIADDEIHKKRIYLDHHVNKVVESIDDEEEVDRFVHKKYYVMKKKELGSTEKMNDLEDELDKDNISYYDFGKNETIAIKIYTQNEVRLNRIFEKLDFKTRCVDIAHYTDDWYSTSDADVQNESFAPGMSEFLNETVGQDTNQVAANDLTKQSDGISVKFECKILEDCFVKILGHKITYQEAANFSKIYQKKFKKYYESEYWLNEIFIASFLDENIYNITSFNELKYFTDTKEISIGAFDSWSKLEHITLPESILKIESDAFWNCASLEELYIPDKCEEIHFQAFKLCKSLKKIKLPNNLKLLDNNVFKKCEALEEIEYKGQFFKYGDGFNFLKCLQENNVKTPFKLNHVNQFLFTDCQKMLFYSNNESAELQTMDTFLNETVGQNINQADNSSLLQNNLPENEIFHTNKELKQFFIERFDSVFGEDNWDYRSFCDNIKNCVIMWLDDDCHCDLNLTFYENDEENVVKFLSFSLTLEYAKTDEDGETHIGEQKYYNEYYLKLDNLSINTHNLPITVKDAYQISEIFIKCIKASKSEKFPYNPYKIRTLEETIDFMDIRNYIERIDNGEEIAAMDEADDY